jgi:S1-C subfamily serine protease
VKLPFLLAAAVAVAIVGGASCVHAQEARRSRLGIQGRFEEGYGLVVERVRFRSPAGQLGLEAGDVIRAIDGRWLRTEADYRRQLRNADLSAQLIIRDVRTGRLLLRPIDVRRQQPR